MSLSDIDSLSFTEGQVLHGMYLDGLWGNLAEENRHQEVINLLHGIKELFLYKNVKNYKGAKQQTPLERRPALYQFLGMKMPEKKQKIKRNFQNDKVVFDWIKGGSGNDKLQKGRKGVKKPKQKPDSNIKKVRGKGRVKNTDPGVKKKHKATVAKGCRKNSNGYRGVKSKPKGQGRKTKQKAD